MMRNMEQDTRDIHVQRKFQPGLVGTIAAMAGVAALASLGLWQLDRADQKTALADAFEAGYRFTVVQATERAIVKLRVEREL